MKNFTQELKDILKEDPGVPILSPDDVRGRANTMVVLTNQAPPKLLALAGSSRRAILLNYKPLMITFPNQKGVYKVQPDDIVFENHHTGRDVTEAGAEETSYEKFFASAMKKFGVASPIELSPDDTKKFFNYVDKNWDAEEESDGSQSEGGCGGGWEDPPRLGGEPSLITPMEGDGSKTEILPALARGAMAVGKIAGKLGGDENEDVSTGKVGKKDKGSYQHAYKLALKKYQIHSADELDTPAERKGFTAYVDRLWKGGEVKDHALSEITPEEKARRKKATAAETQRREKAQATNVKKRVAGSEKTAAEKNKEKLDAQRKRNQDNIKRKAEQQRKRKEQERKSGADEPTKVMAPTARQAKKEKKKDDREKNKAEKEARREDKKREKEDRDTEISSLKASIADREKRMAARKKGEEPEAQKPEPNTPSAQPSEPKPETKPKPKPSSKPKPKSKPKSKKKGKGLWSAFKAVADKEKAFVGR